MSKSKFPTSDGWITLTAKLKKGEQLTIQEGTELAALITGRSADEIELGTMTQSEKSARVIFRKRAALE